MLAALLIAGGAVAHAAWNIVLKHSRASGMAFLTLTVVVGIIVLAPVGAPALVSSARDGTALGFLVAGGFLHVSYFLLLQHAYRVADVSLVYPLARGTGPLVSIAAAIVVLGERPSPTAVMGGIVVVLGVVLIGFAGVGASARSPITRARSSTGIRHAGNSRGVVLGVAVGILIAGYTVVDAVAVTRLGLEPLGYFWGSLVIQLAILLVVSRPRLAGLRLAAREHGRAILIVGVLSPVAYVLVLTAYRFAPVAIVAPAREASVVIIALAGWLLFGEPHPRARLAGSAVVLAGVALLSAG
jgi:drug/metabolite transporter (DMT)-like permease